MIHCLEGCFASMNQRFLGIIAIAVTWLAVIYLIVSMLVFWTAIQRDWDKISGQVVLQDLVSSLLWIKELFQ